jgi:hypothetical protein
MFAATIGDHAIEVFFAICALVYIARRITTAVDDDGQVKKTLNEGIASCIRRMLK